MIDADTSDPRKSMLGKRPLSSQRQGRRIFLKTTGTLAAGLVTNSAFPLAANSVLPYQSAGTRKMAALIRQIWEQSDWKTDPNKPAERADYYRAQLKRNLTLEQEFNVRFVLGKELLRFCKTDTTTKTWFLKKVD